MVSTVLPMNNQPWRKEPKQRTDWLGWRTKNNQSTWNKKNKTQKIDIKRRVWFAFMRTRCFQCHSDVRSHMDHMHVPQSFRLGSLVEGGCGITCLVPFGAAWERHRVPISSGRGRPFVRSCETCCSSAKTEDCEIQWGVWLQIGYLGTSSHNIGICLRIFSWNWLPTIYNMYIYIWW